MVSPEIHDFPLDDQLTVDFYTANELITQIFCKYLQNIW